VKARRSTYAADKGSTEQADKALAEAQVAIGEIVLLVQEGLDLVERSEYRDHLYDVSGHIIEQLPKQLLRVRESVTKARAALITDKSKKAYRAPAEDLAGVQTLVRRDEDTSEGVSDHDRTRERALPQKSDRSPGQDRRQPLDTNDPGNVPKQYFNVPPGTGGADEGLSKTRTRQRPQPGEERGVPYKDTPLLTRRTMEGLWRQAVRRAMQEVYGR
jgi:hypothetical protein